MPREIARLSRLDHAVYDDANLAAPAQIGTYRTPNSLGTDSQSAGDYVIHNPLVVGTDVYLSWYSDGIRVVDASDPRTPHEVAFFVPPSVNNPVKPSQRGVLSNAPQVWGVAYDEATGLIYASDMNSGCGFCAGRITDESAATRPQSSMAA
jgi:hypothetical protein